MLFCPRSSPGVFKVTVDGAARTRPRRTHFQVSGHFIERAAFGSRVALATAALRLRPQSREESFATDKELYRHLPRHFWNL